MTGQYRSLSAYLYAYECAITRKPKPISTRFEQDVNAGYADGKADLHKQMLTMLEVGTVQ